MRRWWNEQTPPFHLGVVGILCGAFACYAFVVVRNVPLGAITLLSIWDIGCLMVSTAPNYRLWAPRGRFLRLIKSYIDTIHSIRYGRGQRLLRVGVTVIVLVLAAATVVWTATS